MAGLDLQFQGRLGRRQGPLCLVAVFLVRRPGRAAGQFVELAQHLGKEVPPAAHALLGVRFGQFPRAFDVSAAEGEAGLEVVALQLLRHRLAVEAAEPIERLLDAILQVHVAGHGQFVGVVEGGFVAEHLHEALGTARGTGC